MPVGRPKAVPAWVDVHNRLYFALSRGRAKAATDMMATLEREAEERLAAVREAEERNEAEHRAGMRVFFAGLTPAISVAVQAQKVLDRVAATNFSVFHYFKENENLVSGIFADLLRPDGSHGQGTAFLQLFLQEIDRGDRPALRRYRDYGSLERCAVYTEYPTSAGRRVDIVLKLEDKWIGVENKPWPVNNRTSSSTIWSSCSRRMPKRACST